MVKIEKLNGATATVVRNTKPMAVYVGMVLTDEEFESVVVESGTLVYSVNEQEVLEKTTTETKSSTVLNPESVVVESGTLVYSVNEQEVLEKTTTETKSSTVLNPESVVTVPEPVVSVPAPEQEPAVATTKVAKIVYPKKQR